MALAVIGNDAQCSVSSEAPPPFRLPSASLPPAATLVSEVNIESNKSPKTRTPIRSPKRTLSRKHTFELMNKLEQREREVQALLAAGEEVMQSSCSGSASTTPFHIEEESPLGFQWEVPDFVDVLNVVARGSEQLAKRSPPEDISDHSPLKRARSLAHSYEGIGEKAKSSTSTMSDMTERLARLSDPQYLEWVVRMSNLTQCKEHLSDPQFLDDLWALRSSALREENRKLQASLTEAQREKAEMSKVLMILEGRLAESNEHLRDIVCVAQAEQPKHKIKCGSALQSVSVKARQCPTNVKSISSSRSSTSRAITNRR